MRSSGEASPHLRWLPLALLLFGLASTIGAAYTLAEISRGRAALRFATSVEQTRAAIEGRITAQISLLGGLAGLFATGAQVDRESFHRYVERLNIRENYPGVQGLGFSMRVAPAERAALLERTRAMGMEEFRIWPEGPRDEYHTILFLEPLDTRNKAAVGYDMFTEPTRREAMERACDTGQPALSGKVTLVQEIDAQKQAGFLIYMPIYRGGMIPPDVAERRAQLIGFAYSPFRADDLFRGIFREEDVSRVSFAIYDGPLPTPQALLHQSFDLGGALYTPAHSASETIMVAGRPWTITYHSQPIFDAASDTYVAPTIMILGVIGSVIIYLLVQAQTSARLQAEQAVKARDTFLSVASHELKTPLTALSGNAQLLKRRIAGSDRLTPAEQRNVDAIVEGSRRLRKLVDELLDHTRLQEGRLLLEPQYLDLGDLVAHVATEIRPTLTRHTLAVYRVPEALPIIGDPLRIEQVLLNLIGNGIKYSPSGGLIEVRLEYAEPWAVLEVCDQGIGIPAAALPLLFEQFYRASNAIDMHIAGMGIGLYVVKAIIERHGGTIRVSSTEGQGSTFRVCLPLAEATPPLSAPAHQSDPPVPLPRP
ncbi:MAG: hypothetical protein HGA45_11790 [Chloroflexales bacterium]|nr:hypothetical protein [Chloroflexales bacterium]